MSRPEVRTRSLVVIVGLAFATGACGSRQPGSSGNEGGRPGQVAGAGGGAGAAGQGGAAGRGQTSGDAGDPGSAGGASSGGVGGGNGGAAGEPGITGRGGSGGGSGAGGFGGAAGRGAEGGGQGGTATGGAAGTAGVCPVPSTVSFQKDVQSFLSTTCGGGNGCHVVDGTSTVSSGGYDHAYDWITAGAHPSSCPETPTPKRFQVVLDVIAHANPSTCSKSRIMPPQNQTGANLRKPLTACQLALLQGWLQEPLVTQAHRVDDTDPAGTAPFPMPPFN